MDINASILTAWAWVAENPAGALVALVGALTALVAGYYRAEPAIKAHIESTTATWDDAAFARVASFFAVLDNLLRIVALFLPALVERARRSGVPALGESRK